MKKLYRAEEVSKMLSVSVPTIWRWVNLGLFPKPKKIGLRTTVWEKDQLDEYFNLGG